MNCRCLRAVLKCVHSRKSVATPERIRRIVMRFALTNNGLIVPLDYPIEETHRPRMRNELADFGFADL